MEGKKVLKFTVISETEESRYVSELDFIRCGIVTKAADEKEGDSGE